MARQVKCATGQHDEMMPGSIRVARAALIALMVTGARPLAAHHSFAMYDHTRTLTLRGTVTKFQWTLADIFQQRVVGHAFVASTPTSAASSGSGLVHLIDSR